MNAQLSYVLLALFAVNGQAWGKAASSSERAVQQVVQADAKYRSNMGVVVMDSLVLEGNSSSSLPASRSRPTPSKASSKPSRFSTPLTLSTPATISKQTVTVTIPPIPSAATATASPGGNDLSKITNLLFAILLVVTVILMVITGVCMFDLRRRYQDVSLPSYNQLKSVPV